MDSDSWLFVCIASVIIIGLLCLCFAFYTNSPNRLCFVGGTGAVEGLIDVNAEYIPEGLIKEFKVTSFSGGFSAWIPCSRLGGS